ncbi:cellular tumor antigen p53-like isoform X2 [Neocloeon triangulifer]|uniref:cellular tumor antigen p53-like isoform X2 n=1 Tax=Neocloeon triangulifer TaxID=2078957 RepID=UPI00286F78F0|nr:cellular tumor antigen p53-like isoform X2 [Neocloeon triangulifer]
MNLNVGPHQVENDHDDSEHSHAESREGTTDDEPMVISDVVPSQAFQPPVGLPDGPLAAHRGPPTAHHLAIPSAHQLPQQMHDVHQQQFAAHLPNNFYPSQIQPNFTSQIQPPAYQNMVTNHPRMPMNTFTHHGYPSTIQQSHGQIVRANNIGPVCRNVSNQATCELPSMEEFPGNFDFQIHVAKALEDSKRPAWEYSEILNKLYVMEGRNVPIQFKVNNIDPSMYVRAVAVYCDPDSSNKPVLRCPKHMRLDEPLNKDYGYIDHVIRANNQNASYEKDPQSERRSVSVPLGIPQPGSEYVTVLYSLMCRSSCDNGINRRSLALLFTLEISGRVIGRQVLPIRICASPHRDRMLDERKATKGSICGQASPGGLTVKEEDMSSRMSHLPESPDDHLGPLDQMFFVPVNNCDDYIVLARLAKDLVLRDYPEGPLKDAELNRYQSILNTMGDNQQ